MRFCREFFHQDVMVGNNTIEGVIEDYNCVELIRFKSEVKSFLAQILKSNMSENELEEIWTSCGAELYFVGPEAMRFFFQKVHDGIAVY